MNIDRHASCATYRLMHEFNIETAENKNGTVTWYCKKVTCLFEPYINCRTMLHFHKYKNAFESTDKVYFDTFGTNIETVKEELSNMFKKVIVFDCFDHSEAYFQIRKKELLRSDCIKLWIGKGN